MQLFMAKRSEFRAFGLFATHFQTLRIIGRHHQDGHGENALGDVELCPHHHYLVSLIELTGSNILCMIIAGLRNNSSTVI